MLNKILLIGNLVDDPRELRTTNSGQVVTDFRIAVNDRFGREDRRTLFIDVTVWGRTAENCHKYLGKGRGVLVEGRLEEDTWDDRETGKPRSKMRVVASQVTFMPGRGEGSGEDRPGGGAMDERDEGASGGGDSRGGGSRDRAPSGGGGDTGGSPLKDYGLDGEVPF